MANYYEHQNIDERIESIKRKRKGVRAQGKDLNLEKSLNLRKFKFNFKGCVQQIDTRVAQKVKKVLTYLNSHKIFQHEILF